MMFLGDLQHNLASLGSVHRLVDNKTVQLGVGGEFFQVSIVISKMPRGAPSGTEPAGRCPTSSAKRARATPATPGPARFERTHAIVYRCVENPGEAP